jgi:DNA-binding NarL/FixJ family response regulator
MPRPPVRVVLANDDQIIIEGLRAMLRPYADQVEVVGTAVGDPEILMADDEEPGADVILIDAFSRPRLRFWRATRRSPWRCSPTRTTPGSRCRPCGSAYAATC